MTPSLASASVSPSPAQGVPRPCGGAWVDRVARGTGPVLGRSPELLQKGSLLLLHCGLRELSPVTQNVESSPSSVMA